jgi:hypothetical protein
MTTKTNRPDYWVGGEVARRKRVEARPRMNTRETCTPCGESWVKRALIRYEDVLRLVGPEPPEECERLGCDRRPCDVCRARVRWESPLLDVVQEVTGWWLCATAHNHPGRPFAWAPSVYRHFRHPGVVVVSWTGGLDV